MDVLFQLLGVAETDPIHVSIPVPGYIVYRELHASGRFETMTRTVDEEEHSIEMHLPYVAKVMERWGKAEGKGEEWRSALS